VRAVPCRWCRTLPGPVERPVRLLRVACAWAEWAAIAHLP
jgi:hypothetical protein